VGALKGLFQVRNRVLKEAVLFEGAPGYYGSIFEGKNTDLTLENTIQMDEYA
jgi:hypothetical protein